MLDLGYPSEAVTIIASLYTKATMSFHGEALGSTLLIHILIGATQGDTSSSYLFGGIHGWGTTFGCLTEKGLF